MFNFVTRWIIMYSLSKWKGLCKCTKNPSSSFYKLINTPGIIQINFKRLWKLYDNWNQFLEKQSEKGCKKASNFPSYKILLKISFNFSSTTTRKYQIYDLKLENHSNAHSRAINAEVKSTVERDNFKTCKFSLDSNPRYRMHTIK